MEENIVFLLTKPVDFCILSTDYLRNVVEVASLEVKVPYTEEVFEAFYRKDERKEEGFHITGLSMNWRKTSDIKDIGSGENFPIGNLFIPKKLFLSLDKGKHWLVMANEKRMVYFTDGKGEGSSFMYIIDELIAPLTDSELPRKAIDCFITGM